MLVLSYISLSLEHYQDKVSQLSLMTNFFLTLGDSSRPKLNSTHGPKTRKYLTHKTSFLSPYHYGFSNQAA